MLDDVELFLRLNDEYRPKPLIPNPTKYDPDSLNKLGRRRAGELNAAHNIQGKRVLEMGCGHGETARALAKDYGCQVVAVDIEPILKQRWAEHDSGGVDFRLFDVTRENPAELGKFDFIYSNGTLEHVVRPFTLLSALIDLIPAGGRMHFNMGLHRGTMGSHLYREVLFPWPHLLFTNSTFERFYERIGQAPRRPVWINHICAAQWLEMFDVLGLHAENVWYHVRPLDRPFYERFEEILSQYPIYDLERDLMYLDLVKPEPDKLMELVDAPHPGASTTLKRTRTALLQQEVQRIERIATLRLEELGGKAAKGEGIPQFDPIAGLRSALQEFKSVSADLQQKVSRLQVIEERINADTKAMRKLGRAVSWPGSQLKSLVQPKGSKEEG